MATSRATALRSLQRAALNRHQTRQLHMTDSVKYPARLAASESSALNFPGESSGRQPQHNSPPRSFSTSDSAYDGSQPLYTSAQRDVLTAAPPAPFAATTQKARHFNTSRRLKSVGDTSTIDFAYLPELPADEDADAGYFQVRVPILPLVYGAGAPAAHPPRVAEVLADHDTPTVATVAADGTHHSAPSALADVHDAGGHTLDFHEVAEMLTDAARKVTLGTERGGAGADEVRRAKGLLKQVWTGLLEDVFGQQRLQAGRAGPRAA